MPLAYIYGLITLIRNRLYDWQFLKVTKFDIHTIGVGNLSVGGAGKTPHVEYLIKLLLNEEPRIATLSRGYKRKTKGFVLADDLSSAEQIGDEPLIYKYKYNIQVAVDSDRVNGVKKLLASETNVPKIVLLDDVFQHRSIKCGLNIIVSDFNQLYFNDVMLPAGTLREFKSGVNRADIIIVSKVPEKTSPIEIRNILKDIKPLAHQQVFFSYLKYGELYAINNKENKIDTLNDLYRYTIVSFAGIANEKPMTNYLKEYAANLKHLKFPDHHEFSIKDLEDIEYYYNSIESGNKLLVTTEKDFMRLMINPVWENAKRMNIYILPVEVTFKEKEEEFNQVILKYVRANRIYHKKHS
jgi:tetraacyldisaccharide 4'-kinase